MIKVVADENIGFVTALLTGLAQVTVLPGRVIERGHLAEADALIVRAVTDVNAALLQGTPVQFVGTTTSGFDHIDRAWLDSQGLAFAYAPGSNANSVAEYVVAALLELAHRFKESLRDKTIGVIGAGHIGSQMAAKAQALGLRVLLNDPPLFDATGDPRYRPLAEVLRQSDIVSLHVPLTADGPYPTHQMVNESFLQQMKAGAWFVNASRGPVADEVALKSALRQRHIGAAVLDVWADEPAPDQELIELAAIATPHIAGYSYNGKIKAVRSVIGALSAHFDIKPNWGLLDEALPLLSLELPESVEGQVEDILHRVINGGVYDIVADDRNFREAMRQGSNEERGARFDAMRKNYPRRYEFPTYRLIVPQTVPPDSPFHSTLAGMGFRI